MKLSHRILLLLAAAFAAFGASGCSADARQNRHLTRARAYQQAGELEKAEIEYINVLRKNSSHAAALAGLGMIYFDQGRLGRVFALLSKAKTVDPDNLEVRGKLGRVYFNGGKLKEARDEALFVLSRQPANGDAAILLAESCQRLPEVEEALARLRPQVQDKPERALILAAVGLLELKRQNPQSAATWFERARTLDPKNSIVHLCIATQYRVAGDLEAALAATAEAARHAPIRSGIRVQHARLELDAKHLDNARRILEDLVKQAPDFITPYYTLAEIAFTEKKYDESQSYLDRVLAREPTLPDAMALRAKVFQAKGEQGKAVGDLQRASDLFPQAAQLQYELAVAHVRANNPAKASVILAELRRTHPEFPAPTLLLAEIQSREGNLPQAVENLRALITKHPKLAPAHAALANAYLKQGNLDEAIAALRVIDERFPGNPMTSVQLGAALARQNKPDEARSAFDRALTISPDLPTAWEHLVSFELQQRNHTAIEQRLQTEIARRPDAAAIHLLLARVQVAAGRTSPAIETLQKLIKLQPDNPVAYVTLARLHMSGGDPAQAVAKLEQAVQASPTAPEPLMLLAVLQQEQRKYEAARDTYEKLIALSPRFGVALNNLAYLYLEHFSNPARAADLAQKARELMPKEPHVADTLGWALYKQGQYARALPVLVESADRLQDSAEVKYHLGMTQYARGQEAAAQASLARALELKPDFAGSETARRALKILALDPATAEAAAVLELQRSLGFDVDPVALVRLGAIHERQGRPAEAAAAYEQALKASPNHIRAALGAVRVYRNQQAAAKALELAKAMRKIAPNDPDVAAALGALAFDSGDMRWAHSLLQEATRGQNVEPAILYTFAQAAYVVGNVTEAEASLQTLVRNSPEFPQAPAATEFLAMARLAQDPAKAISNASRIERSASSDAASPAALLALGTLKRHQHDVPAAIAALQRAVSRYPQFALAQRELAIVYSESAEPDPAALELAGKAREAFPEDPLVAKAFGVLQFRRGNYERAATLLDECARSRTDDAELLYYLGMSQHQLKRQAGAATLRKALDLNLRPDLATRAQQALAQKQ